MEKTAGRKRSDGKTRLELKGKRAVSGAGTSFTWKAFQSQSGIGEIKIKWETHKKRKEESHTVDEMRNTFDCMPSGIYGEGESKAEKIKAKLQRQVKT